MKLRVGLDVHRENIGVDELVSFIVQSQLLDLLVYEVKHRTRNSHEVTVTLTVAHTLLAENIGDIAVVCEAKKMGFSDKYIAKLWKKSEIDIYEMRRKNGVNSV